MTDLKHGPFTARQITVPEARVAIATWKEGKLYGVYDRFGEPVSISSYEATAEALTAVFNLGEAINARRENCGHMWVTGDPHCVHCGMEAPEVPEP